MEYLHENYFAPDYFTYVVIDELHHAVNEQYQRIDVYKRQEYGLTPYETREILFYKTDNGEVRVEILLYQEDVYKRQPQIIVPVAMHQLCIDNGNI